MNITTILEKLAPLSDRYGSGDPRLDLSLLLFMLIVIALVLIVLSLFGGRRNREQATSSSPLPEGLDRLTALAGKFEKLEMNANASRTEVMREVELLKARVEQVEEQTGLVDTSRASEAEGLGTTYLQEPAISEGEEALASSPVELTDEVSRPATVVSLPPAPMIPAADDIELDTAAQHDIRPAAVINVHSVVLTGEETQGKAGTPRADDKTTPPKDLSAGLTKTRSGIFRRIKEVFSGRSVIDEETIEELQAFLVSTDLGLKMVQSLTERLREVVKRGDTVTEEALIETLQRIVLHRLKEVGADVKPIIPVRRHDGPLVVMMVGVNGVGKTTTTAKLALQWKQEGAKVLMVGADTFRAAAAAQLQKWGEELDITVHTGGEGAKPAAVVYDAMEKANTERYDVVLIDTAGRLHTKGNLMQELEGMKNIVRKNQLDAPHEVLLVIDGTTGQNALQQAKEFHSSVHLTGLVVTKLDGTARGGMVVAVQDEYGVPVRYIGMGEAADDLRPFEITSFVDALFDREAVSELSAPSAHGKRRRRRREEDERTLADQLA
ncbi:MAG: signal recognition particle-docking protein FtsY [Bdellovibrionota bacterium]|jgi:fused signal recognition particle receptor